LGADDLLALFSHEGEDFSEQISDFVDDVVDVGGHSVGVFPLLSEVPSPGVDERFPAEVHGL